MILQNTSQTPLKMHEPMYDTLVVSYDHRLFSQFSAFLREFEPDRKPFLVDDPGSFTSNEKSFNQCDVLICDMRGSGALGAYAVDCVPSETLAVGLASTLDCPEDTLCRQQNLRFSGIIDHNNGWFSNWNKITAIKQAWHNPLMVSRIEEVPVSDVLQMIAAGRWSVVVHITGYGMSSLPLLPDRTYKGCISFYQGVPQTAWSWNSAGIQAMFDLLSLKKGILQVVKNLCTPTIRNIYLQTDEILLSHAVALDESGMLAAVANEPVHQAMPDPVPAKTDPERENTSWWSINGKQLMTTIAEASDRSFPVRMMTGEEIFRIQREQTDAQLLLLYGSAGILSDFFSHCARGFSSEKMNTGNCFPVIRLGRSGDPCLYIAGSFPSDDTFTGKDIPAIFISSDSSAELCLDPYRRGHSAVLQAGSPTPEREQAESGFTRFSFPKVKTLSGFEHTWQGYAALLQEAATTLKHLL
jgi:hypothetical protein